MGEILSAQTVERLWPRDESDTDTATVESLTMLCASHEALRARLAEVEAEHDETRVKLMFAWRDRRAVDRRLAEVEQVVRKVAQHPCYDVREWVGEVVPCGSCPSCITRAVLDKGEPK